MNVRSRVLLASAGSGKTFQLTTHFLALLAAGAPPERIVASTFTRKAAGEILARVFTRLARAASSEAGAEHLGRELGLVLDRARAIALLGQLARSIQRFRVRTLDAFFVELARSGAADLGLPPDWRVGDEVELARARDRALMAALAQSERAVWSTLLAELERGRGGRSVHAVLARVVDESHRLHVDSRAGAWDAPRPMAGPDDEHFAAAAEYVLEFQAPRTKSGSRNMNWLKAQSRVHSRALARDYEGLLGAGLAKAALAPEPSYYGLELPQDLRQALEALVLRAAAHLGGELRAQNAASARLLDTYERELEQVRARARRLAFDDLARVLGRSAATPTADLALRVDGQIDHLLLDEFQDTSPSQWRVLREIAAELAADGTGARSVFCVGDVKQSIYGWRAAEPRLLEQLPHELHLEPESLDRSWRSSPVVLEAVNRVFGAVASFPGWSNERGDLRTAQDFAAWFHPHVAQRSELSGCVRIWTCAPKRGDADPWPQCVEAAVERVLEIRAEAPWATVGVLLRRNKLAPRLVSRLREAGVAASDEGGNPLDDAASVQAALALLHWLEHPADTIARFHVASSALAPRLGLALEASEADFARAHASASRLRMDLGLAAWLARWRDDVARALGEWEARRFAALIDLALASPPGAPLADFAERVRRQRVEDASSARVKVMTIHASKGLEFDAVVLPELDGPLLGRGSAFLARRADDDPREPFELLSHSGGETLRAALALGGDPRLVEAHHATRRRALRDSLSALYVALTRARRRLDLILWSEGASKNEPRQSAGALLRHAFALGFENLQPSSLVISEGAAGAAWAERADDGASEMQREPHAPRDEFAPVPLRFAPSARPRELERVSPSGLRPSAPVSLAEHLAPPTSFGARRGSRWHAWFEQIEWIEDFTLDDAALAALAERRALGGEGLAEDLRAFRAALERRPVRELLSRPAHAVELWRERRFRLLREGALLSGAFDRVTIVRDGGRAVRARILDFKSDRSGEEHALERYGPQMRGYRSALAQLAGLAPERIQATLVFAESGRCVEIPV